MTESHFEEIFKSNYNGFCKYAFTLINDTAGAEDITQEVFVDFWNKGQYAVSSGKHEQYLVRAIKYKCFDFLRKRSLHSKYINEATHQLHHEQNLDTNSYSDEEIHSLLDSAIDKLPDKTKQVFVLCKKDKMSYGDVARTLGISEKTVENQMGRAFKHLRLRLSELQLAILVVASLFNLFIKILIIK